MIRIAVKYTEIKTGMSKVVLMEPKALNFLLKVQQERDNKELAKAAVGGEGDNGDEEVNKNGEKDEGKTFVSNVKFN